MIKILIPIILILAAIGLFFGYIDPTYKDVQGILEKQEELDLALNKSKELQAIRDKLLSRYNTFSTNNLERLTKLLPDNVDNVRLVLDIDNIASKYNMRIKSVAVKQARNRDTEVIGPTEEQYESVVLAFSVTSSYEDIMSFMRDLEDSLRIVDIDEFSLNKSVGDLYEYNISIRTYWLR